MNPLERINTLKGIPVGQYLQPNGRRPPFPETLDNTVLSTYRKCQKQVFLTHLLGRVSSTDNIHLVAGGAYAAGMEAFRKAYFGKTSDIKGDKGASLDKGLYALIKHYGYDEARESNDHWASSPKSCERLIVAFLDYWEEYDFKAFPGKMVYLDGEVAAELGGVLELDVLHPETGKPLLYSFRFDYMEKRNGNLWLGDDKTTTSLGPSWADQWKARSQFLGYVYAARKVFGIEPVGVIARGTGILKTQIKHMEVPVTVPPFLANRWWVQVNQNAREMVQSWKDNDWDYDFGDACTSYGGCDKAEVCISQLQHKVLGSMAIRIWNPEDPENSPTVEIKEL